MSLFSNTMDCNTENIALIPLVFVVPYVLRKLLGIQAQLSGMYSKCYFQLSFLSISGYIFSAWPSYWTLVLFVITVDIFLLALASANKIEIDNYFELFNTLTFYSLVYTTSFFWISIGITWAIIAFKNLTTGKFNSVAVCLVQISAAYGTVLAGYDCKIAEFYVFLTISMFLMLIHAEFFSSKDNRN